MFVSLIRLEVSWGQEFLPAFAHFTLAPSTGWMFNKQMNEIDDCMGFNDGIACHCEILGGWFFKDISKKKKKTKKQWLLWFACH